MQILVCIDTADDVVLIIVFFAHANSCVAVKRIFHGKFQDKTAT